MDETTERAQLVADLQERVDRILAGEVDVAYRTEERPFTAFFAEDKREASALAARWMSIADDQGGVTGLAHAVDGISESLGNHRPGVVEHATLLFLTHHPEARAQLVVRSLEERQPGLVTSSVESRVEQA